MYKILVVDDEEDIVYMIKEYLERQGYLVYTAYNAREALEKLKYEIDLILLDVMMPDINGYELCLKIRDKVRGPIIFLTAKVNGEDIVQGLESGGDDYLTKPFSLKELKARITSHLRREARQLETPKRILCHKNCIIDLSGELVEVNGKNINLTKKEFEIISFLVKHKGQIFSKEQIYEKIWGYDGEGESRTITEHIKNIRKKINDSGETEEYIATVWGIGYKCQ